MPAITRVEDTNGTSAADPNNDVLGEQHTSGEEAGEKSRVTEYLDMALTAASDEAMSAAELMGLFHYYAYSIAESYRQDMIGDGTT